MMMDSTLTILGILALSCAVTYLLGYRQGTRKTYEGILKIVGKGLLEHHKDAQG